jgi:hypothetical protein
MGSLIETTSLIIDLVAVENGKPKNKFSLTAIGNSAFRDVLKPTYDYGSSIFTTCDLLVTLRDFPTMEELSTWLSKHKSVILSEYMTNHNEVEAEYLQVVACCNTREWDKAYWEDRKDYYENRYSHGTEQPEYTNVIRELGKLA